MTTTTTTDTTATEDGADRAEDARAATSRLRVRGWLRALAPLHVGGVGQDPNAPLSVALDGRGRPYVPGTSLAGALRSLLHPGPDPRTGPRGEAAGRLWGHAEERGQGGSASRIVVHDALVTTGCGLDGDGLPLDILDAARLETRFSVGIDRRTGTAAHGFLHARSVIPKGSLLRLELDLNTRAETEEADTAHLKALLHLLSRGQLRVGGARTRGLGRLELVSGQTEVREQRFDSAAGLFAALAGEGERWAPAAWQEAPAPVRQVLSVSVVWNPTGPLMVRSGTDGFTVDALPMVGAAAPGKVALVLPGSSLKGVLRSRAEHIERTVRRLDAPGTDNDDAPEADRSAAFRRQLDQLPAVSALFGAAPLGGEDDPRGAGVVTVDDCQAKQLMPADLWDRVHEPAADEASSPFAELRDRHRLERADHVAVDRWTGGAADGRLYSVLEPHGLTWSTIGLTVDLGRLTHRHGPLAEAALALLLLVLRDLKAGRVPLGYATNRGMGDIDVRSVTLTLPGRADPVELEEYLAGAEAEKLTARWCDYIDGKTA
ncbi:RAMP superfamily CRISPR-associated protein [Streptomyces sp. NPDC001380]|uniref:RAMP superfamily CRISPR-associated protein n=1 Tax=Streptomyces sp. NPDC001380 TaxID=3364566 RepID=UPI003686223E